MFLRYLFARVTVSIAVNAGRAISGVYPDFSFVDAVHHVPPVVLPF